MVAELLNYRGQDSATACTIESGYAIVSTFPLPYAEHQQHRVYTPSATPPHHPIYILPPKKLLNSLLEKLVIVRKTFPHTYFWRGPINDSFQRRYTEVNLSSLESISVPKEHHSAFI